VGFTHITGALVTKLLEVQCTVLLNVENITCHQQSGYQSVKNEGSSGKQQQYLGITLDYHTNGKVISIM